MPEQESMLEVNAVLLLFQMGAGGGFNIFLTSGSKAKNHGARYRCSGETPVKSM